jgi:hypothetical protein
MFPPYHNLVETQLQGQVANGCGNRKGAKLHVHDDWRLANSWVIYGASNLHGRGLLSFLPISACVYVYVCVWIKRMWAFVYYWSEAGDTNVYIGCVGSTRTEPEHSPIAFPGPITRRCSLCSPLVRAKQNFGLCSLLNSRAEWNFTRPVSCNPEDKKTSRWLTDRHWS